MESALKTWYGLFGKLMTSRQMTLVEAVEWCKPYEEANVAYEAFEGGK